MSKSMSADLKQVLLKPARRDKDGKVLHPQYAAVNLNIPINSPADEKKVARLFLCLDDGDVLVSIEARQPRLFDHPSVEEVEDDA